MEGTRAGKLLLVEDEDLLRGLIAQFLRMELFDVSEAADGAEAIGLYTGSGPFDVVLLDLNLPRICGVEVCRRIKCMTPSQSVVVCSAAILDSDLVELREMQVEQFLSKPYHPAELVSRIRHELARLGRLKSSGRAQLGSSSGAAVLRADGAGRHGSFTHL
jgi:DNA-binding response OmpR family regulator